MGNTLREIAEQLNESPKKVQLIYAFNGVGKTRLSREFKELIEVAPSGEEGDTNSEDSELAQKNILYYSAFTEDLFYWDNDLNYDEERKLKIHPNAFTHWVFVEQGQEPNIIANFQHYTSSKLTPNFNHEYTIQDENGQESTIKAFSEVSFSIERGGDNNLDNLKISKGEESNFIWSIFYSLIEEVINELNKSEEEYDHTNPFQNLKYIFIDDPVSSLDENHLIELAVHLAQLIKSNNSEVNFIITTHNPLFYNVLHNELSRNDANTGYKHKVFEKYRLEKYLDGTYEIINQPTDSPFSYHLYLKNELEKAIKTGQIHKYHFNFLRNILEKTSTFLGYKNWVDLLPKTNDGRPNPYESRIINISSHSKYSSEEITELTDNDKRVLKYLIEQIHEMYHFKLNDN